MDLERERADEARVLAGVPVGVGQGRPVVLAGLVDLDEEEVPFGLGIAGDVERQRAAGGRDVDRAQQALVREVVDLRIRELGAVGRRREGREQAVVDRVGIGDPALLVLGHVEMADIDRREVRGHRDGRVPRPRLGGTTAGRALERPVGDDLQVGRHGDVERVGRLVQRVVVGREPGRRSVRLAGDDEAGLGGQEARDPDRGGIADRLGHAVVADDRRERRAVGDRRLRVDDQLVLLALELRGRAADRDRTDRQAMQVEVELRERLGRLGRDRGGPAQDAARRVVGDREVVVLDVIPAVPVLGVVRVTEPRGAGRAVHRLGGLGDTTGREQRDQGKEQRRATDHSHTLPQGRDPGRPRCDGLARTVLHRGVTLASRASRGRARIGAPRCARAPRKPAPDTHLGAVGGPGRVRATGRARAARRSPGTDPSRWTGPGVIE